MNKIVVKLGILGATGMGGREAIFHQQKLDETGENYAELVMVTGSPDSQGKKLGKVFKEKEEQLDKLYDFWEPERCPQQYRNMKVESLDPEKIAENVDYVISALPSNVAREIEPELRKRGVNVFSNASEFRWDDDIPLMIPEVNPENIKIVQDQETEGIQVNNPNCTTTGYVPVIQALRDNFKVEKVDIVTFQAISGKGDKIISENYSSSIKGNAIDDWDNESERNGEEVKSETEPQKILGYTKNKEEVLKRGINIDVRTVRIPTQYGHLESLKISFSQKVDKAEFKETLKSCNPLESVKELPSTPEKPILVLDRQPEPKRDALKQDGMAVVVGDIRKIDESTITLFSLSHNLRRGATWTARQSMELYLQKQGQI